MKALLKYIHWHKKCTTCLSQIKCSSTANEGNNKRVHRAETVANLWKLNKPGDNHLAGGYVVTKNTQTLLQDHLKFTGGQVRTRFAPDPNGELHLGHSKAININFGYAIANGGICFLRFDDTNPSTAYEVSTEKIVESIKWLGFDPYQITYTSDYFDQLYQKAKQMIKLNLAYVCHEAYKGKRVDFSTQQVVHSRWRDRPIEESLQEFENMQNGHYKEGEATLRLKYTTADNIVDLIAYRIKVDPHFRTGNKWRVYPTYDFSHGLTDSMQNITHSMCSVEFSSKRPTYYWICNALNVYCPVQVEFGRLNIMNAVVSKRKIMHLIQSGVISGWDDLRLYTLSALRRRGMPTSAINQFTSKFAVRFEANYIDAIELDCIARNQLMMESKRFMCVLNPLKVEITNFPFEEPVKLEVSLYKDKRRGTYDLMFGKDIWIGADDFQEVPSDTFWRLTKGQSVGLKYSHHVISLDEIIKNDDGSIDKLKVTCRHLKDSKRPKAFIHWVFDPLPCQVNQTRALLKNEKKCADADILKEVEMDVLMTVPSYVDRNVDLCEVGEVVQFEREGYFRLDDMASKGKLVFNRTCDLKQKFGFKQ